MIGWMDTHGAEGVVLFMNTLEFVLHDHPSYLSYSSETMNYIIICGPFLFNTFSFSLSIDWEACPFKTLHFDSNFDDLPLNVLLSLINSLIYYLLDRIKYLVVRDKWRVILNYELK